MGRRAGAGGRGMTAVAWLVTEYCHTAAGGRQTADPVLFTSKEKAEEYVAAKQNVWDGGDGTISRFLKEIVSDPGKEDPAAPERSDP